MSALARVLREEYRKSFELSSNIINIFLCFSAYKIFHKMLIDHKVSFYSINIVKKYILYINIIGYSLVFFIFYYIDLLALC